MGEAVKLSINEDKKFTLKANLCVWLVYATEVFRNHMQAELAQCRNLNVELIPLSSFTVDGISSKTQPDIVYIETGVNWAKKIIDLQNEDSNLQGHEASLVVFGNEADNGALRIALRMGASDFLSDKASIGELMPMLKKTAEEKVASRNLGDLILFINTKGGAGATTLALNTACEIASYHNEEVLLVDLDLQFSVIPEYLDVKPKYGIVDILDVLPELDEVSLDSMVTKHNSGVHTLSFLPATASDNYKHAKNFSRLLPLLRQFYSYVVVDLSRGIDSTFASIVAPATDIYLIAQQNLISIKRTNQLINALQFEYGQPRDNIEVILNRFEKRLPIRLKDIENTVADVPLHLVPNEYKVAIECANLGQPIVTNKKKSAIAKSVVEISHHISSPVREKKGWFGRLFS